MRTQNEIVTKLNELSETDIFGFQSNDIIIYLEFENAKPFLKEGITEEEWEGMYVELSDEWVRQRMIDYMPFAWEKANNCRGLSAGRSMAHFSAWTWMLGDDVYNQFHDLEDYHYYGKDNLVALCDFLDLDHSQWDDGIRSDTEY